jgi:hypothetical protein
MKRKQFFCLRNGWSERTNWFCKKIYKHFIHKIPFIQWCFWALLTKFRSKTSNKDVCGIWCRWTKEKKNYVYIFTSLPVNYDRNWLIESTPGDFPSATRRRPWPRTWRRGRCRRRRRRRTASPGTKQFSRHNPVFQVRTSFLGIMKFSRYEQVF